MRERSPIRQAAEVIKDNPAEAMWCAIGAAALGYEYAAFRKRPDDALLSHAAYRHQRIATGLTLVLGAHFTRAFDRLGAPHLDLVKLAGKGLLALTATRHADG